jgi:hypothetical protein
MLLLRRSGRSAVNADSHAYKFGLPDANLKSFPTMPIESQ